MDKKQSKWEKFTYLRTVLLVAGGIVLWWALQNLDSLNKTMMFIRHLISPVVLALIMAFLLNIPMRFFERVLFRGRAKRVSRPISLIIAAILVLVIILAVINLLIPNTVDAVTQLVARLPQYLEQAETFLEPYLEEYAPSIKVWLEENDDLLTGLLNELVMYLQGIGGALFSSTVNVATSILGQIVTTLIAFVLMCHLLLGKEKLLAQTDGVLRAYLPPKHYDRVKKVSVLTYQSYSGFASGLCLEALMEGVLYCLVLSIGGFHHALLISIIMGCAALIPVLGAWAGAIFGALLLLISMGPMRMVAFIIITLVIQQIGSSVLYPQIIGHSIGLPAIWTLVAVVVGSGLGGIFGILFFIPLFSVIYTLIRQHTVTTLSRKTE